MAADSAWSQTTKEPEKFVGFFAEGAAIYPPGMPIVTGADAIRTTYTEMTKTPGFSLSWTPTKAEVAASGDVGITSGTYEMAMGGTSEKGKYVTGWRKKPAGHGRSPTTSSMPTRLPRHPPARTRWSPRARSSGAMRLPACLRARGSLWFRAIQASQGRSSFECSYRRSTGSRRTGIRRRKISRSCLER